MDFPTAIKQVFAGMSLYRVCWNRPGQYVFIEAVRHDGEAGLANRVRMQCEIHQANADGSIELYTPTQEDMLAIDWEIG